MVIGPADRSPAPDIEEEPCLVQVFALASRAIQLDQREFDLLVAVGLLPLALGGRPEDIADQAGKADRYIKNRSLPVARWWAIADWMKCPAQ